MGCIYTISFIIEPFVSELPHLSSSYTQYYESVPQGCVLSIILFLIAINNIISSLPIDVRSSLDNFAIYTSGSSPLTGYAIYHIKYFFFGSLIMVLNFQLLNPIRFSSPTPTQ